MQELRSVDVVIPIFNAREWTRRCIESVLAHATGVFRVIAVDDASTDAGVSLDLRELAARDPRVVLLVNEQNLGFVGTANRGMRAAGQNDVLLLNSDTEVFAGFLDRLIAAAYSDPLTGIVSALSNNATICSVPEWLKDNPIPAGHTPATLAALIARTSRQLRPEIVTAVGFCMYIKAEVIAAVGLFDEHTFGRGFGEENDFCERAKRQAGYRIRLADDVFVLHKGKASFGDEGRELELRNQRILEKKQPGYLASVHAFIALNPLASLQRELQFMLMREQTPQANAPSTLFLLHASPWAPTPGGTEFHVLDLVAALALPRTLVAYPEGRSLIVAEIFDGDLDARVLYHFPLEHQAPRFCVAHVEIEAWVAQWITLFQVRAAHVHHLLHWPIRLLSLLHERGVPVAFTAHDYYSVCPNWNLFDQARGGLCTFEDGSFPCGPGCLQAVDDRLLPEDASRLRVAHREAFAKGLSTIRAMIFPSEAARRVTGERLALGQIPTHVLPHGYDGAVTTARRKLGVALRIAVIGEVFAKVKGRDSYVALVGLTAGLPVDWYFFGKNEPQSFREAVRAAARGRPVHFVGRHERGEIVDKLVATGIDLCVILPEWPETFSYVLSEACSAGVPVLVNEQGALPERVLHDKTGLVVKDLPAAAGQIARLASDRGLLDRLSAEARAFAHPTIEQMADEYRALYAAIQFGPGPEATAPTLDRLRTLAGHWAGPGPRARLSAAASADVRPLHVPGYQQKTWYPLFRKVKSLMPQPMRERGRELLVRAERPASMRFDAGRAADVAELIGARLLKRSYLRSTLQVQTTDPYLIFRARPFPAAEVKLARFWLRHDLECDAFAQLYWRHAGSERFDEALSARIPLHRTAGTWSEYLVRLDESPLRSLWLDGNAIEQIRFDPINWPGRIDIGPLELCR